MRAEDFDFVRLRHRRCLPSMPLMMGKLFSTASMPTSYASRASRTRRHVINWLWSLHASLRTSATKLPIVAAFIALIAPPVIAATPESHERIVHYRDLDLSSPAGIRTLRRRVATALEAVCGSYAGTQSSGGEKEAEEIAQCRMAASAEVEKRVALILGKSAGATAVH